MAVDTVVTASTRERPSLRWPVLWLGVFAIGVALRVLLFSGYGLGDDPNYFSAYHGIYQSGTWGREVPYDFRFTFWVPVVGFMKLVGVTEWGFVGFVTLCSILNMPLVYALARQEWEREWALVAMGAIAILPLEVCSSTLFVIDIPLATYCYTGFWLYRVARDDAHGPRVRAVAAVIGGVFLFLGYSAKQWGVLVGSLFALEAVRRVRETWRVSALCGGTFALLVAAYFTWEWVAFGDLIYDVHLVRKAAWFQPHSWEQVLDYSKMLLLPSQYGTYFGGWYPHALVVLALLFAARVRSVGKWLLYFLVQLASLSAMPSHRENGQWVMLFPHIFRYLCFLSIPLCLALTAYLRELVRSWPRAGLVAMAALAAWTIVQGVQLTWPTRDAFGEQRRANAFILSAFPDEVVTSDFGYLNRLASFAPDGRGFSRIRELRPEEPVGQAAALGSVTDGIVVTGGGRLPWYGCIRCATSISAFTPPPTWTLVTMYGEAPLAPYRKEPLRIWRVSPSVLRATRLLEKRQDEPGRLALLRNLIEVKDFATAAEIGRRLVEQGVQPLGSVMYLTGLACSKSGKPRCAEKYYTEALEQPLSHEEVWQALVALAKPGAEGLAKARREAADRYRERFPGVRSDSALEDVLSGLNEGVALYQRQRFGAAEARLREIRDRTDEAAERRQRAHYFLTLTLIAQHKTDEGSKEAEAYRSAYGEDGFWAELAYRSAMARLPTQPVEARQLLSELAGGHGDTLWGQEARRQLAALAQSQPPRPNP